MTELHNLAVTFIISITLAIAWLLGYLFDKSDNLLGLVSIVALYAVISVSIISFILILIRILQGA